MESLRRGPGMENEVSFAARSVPVERIGDRSLQELLAYWESRRAGRPFPLRAELLPEDMARLLTRIALVEVAGGDTRFRFRVVGSSLQHALGLDPTGHTLDAITPAAYRDLFAAHFRAVLWSSAPHCRVLEIRRGLRSFTYRCLVLPASQTGEQLDRLLVAANWDEEQAPVRDLLRPRRF